MASFGILAEDCSEVVSFVAKTKERLAGQNFVKNPFVGKILSLSVTGDDNLPKKLILVSMSPVYPNITWFGWLGAIAMLIFFGFHWTLIFPVIFGMTSIFWSKTFYSWIFKKGLKKNGYKGETKSVSLDEIIQYLEVLNEPKSEVLLEK